MTTSVLRFAIILAALVAGWVLLANAFPGPATNVDGVTVSPATSPSPSPSPASTSPSPQPPAASVQGAVLEVLNGTSTTGLAASAAEDLKEAGAVIPVENLGNADEAYSVTTLVHRADSKALAQLLEQRFFPGAKLQQGEANDLPADVEVSVILGEDYAEARAGQ